MRRRHPPAFPHRVAESAHVVVHRVDNVDGVAGTGELAGEVDGNGEAAVGEEDVERGLRGGGGGAPAVGGEAH